MNVKSTKVFLVLSYLLSVSQTWPSLHTLRVPDPSLWTATKGLTIVVRGAGVLLFTFYEPLRCFILPKKQGYGVHIDDG